MSKSVALATSDNVNLTALDQVLELIDVGAAFDLDKLVEAEDGGIRNGVALDTFKQPGRLRFSAREQ